MHSRGALASICVRVGNPILMRSRVALTLASHFVFVQSRILQLLIWSFGARRHTQATHHASKSTALSPFLHDSPDPVLRC